MKIKKILSGVLACAVVCTAVPYVSYSISENISITANAADEYTLGTYEYFEYKAYTDHIEISDCDESVTEVTIPAEINGLPVTVIGDSAFGYLNLKKVTIPDSVTRIENYAFYKCTSLTDITIPDSITSIGGWAFQDCKNLIEITIPESVKSIEYAAFSYCSSLNKVIISEGVTNIEGYAFASCSELAEITIPESVKIIEDGTFSKCSNLASITIPDSVTSIGDSAFFCCSRLIELTIPDGVTSIGENTFKNCSGLTSITIENSECEIYDDSSTISDTATIYGYDGSTAQEYAEKYDRNFVLIGSSENPEKLSGDANGDGTVDVADIVAISAYVGDSEKNPLDEQSITNGDVHNTGDGLTANDALMIQQYLAGSITTLE